MAEGTIYKYFASKQDLLFSFLEAQAIQPLQYLLSVQEGGSVEEVVREFFLGRLLLAERNRPLMKVVMGEALVDSEFAEVFARKVTEPAVTRIRAFVAEQVKRGEFRAVDADVAAGTLAGLFLTFAVLWPTLVPKRARRQSPEKLAEELTELFLRGVLATPEAEEVRS